MTTPPRTPTPLDAAWEALRDTLWQHPGIDALDISIARHRPLVEAALTLEAEDRAEDFVSVRRYSGGVFADGTTNHHPIDYEAEARTAPDPAPLNVERLTIALAASLDPTAYSHRNDDGETIGRWAVEWRKAMSWAARFTEEQARIYADPQP
jgi:hypothetical protein